MAYHINVKGEAGQCRAKRGGCPFGGESEHFKTASEAQLAFEKGQVSISSGLSKTPDFPLGGEAWPDEPGFMYEKALAEAKKLKRAGKFVVVSTSYLAEDENLLDPPEWEDFSDEEDYMANLDEWTAEQPRVHSLDELEYFYSSGVRKHQAVAYASREEFESKLRSEGLPGFGSEGEADNSFDERHSTPEVYKSQVSNGSANPSLAWYYEARVV